MLIAQWSNCKENSEIISLLKCPTKEPLKNRKLQWNWGFCELLWLSVRNRNAYVFSWYFIHFSFFFLFLILRQILMNAKQTLRNAMLRLYVTTHMDLTCAHVNLDLSEMARIVQVQSTVSKAFRFMLTSNKLLFGWLFVVVVYFGNVASNVLILQNRWGWLLTFE